MDVVYHKYKHGEAKPDKTIAVKTLTKKFFALHKRNNNNNNNSKQVSNNDDVKPQGRA